MNEADFIERVRARNPNEPEYLQAVEEVVASLWPFLQDEGRRYLDAGVLERLTEGDRAISFRVAWIDDQGEVQTNRGYRIQWCGVLGPYKGGLRFHPSVNFAISKFLAFEQTFKNALTTLPLGGAKGGADFDPKGKSDEEVMRFCQSFMTELSRYIGPDVDVPAGDIGVGGREIGYLFGQYRRMTGRFEGALTGKGVGWGGSEIRTEATGYGAIFFAQEMFAARDEGLEGKTVGISGAGNVAQYAAEKAIALGAKVVTMSDSSGFIHDPAGIDRDKLEWIKALKNDRRGRIREYAEQFDAEYHEGKKPWSVAMDLALPCATQNELGREDAEALVKNECAAIVEGANMPCTAAAAKLIRERGLLYAPGKAANAGGVATSGLEMTQNSQRMYWGRERVEDELHEIMRDIHRACCEHGKGEDGQIDYVRGANIAGFIRVADAMIAQGAI
ncbi:NADP-specific glutamate dehydrogenase [Pseudenhygromyxa sp. WMMC2535]|uniref:NADP-specific glutamate dehydrogenase n=1 Tax=Pseudenhygromyxa sp. WMMC2535 TaxID=2712867 RepID=UPI001553D519|nr:NADP-specific glutamate dehydrogenase [Pseudenhygromyxa sp. WMMC2535]NVB38668.1 NADP-specific glutamate dehydrogenase [Pseudenhygromyxa sp. WMMC2535]